MAVAGRRVPSLQGHAVPATGDERKVPLCNISNSRLAKGMTVDDRRSCELPTGWRGLPGSINALHTTLRYLPLRAERPVNASTIATAAAYSIWGLSLSGADSELNLTMTVFERGSMTMSCPASPMAA